MILYEKTIKESDEPLKKQLYKAVPESMMHQTFERVLKYLESHGQIA